MTDTAARAAVASDPARTDEQMDQKIRQYLAETLLIEFSEDDGGVREDANLFESGLIDSFGFVQLVAFLEKEFDIKISDDEVLSDSLSSFAKIRSFVEAKVAQ
jgi:acyl carrier protein